MVSTRYNVNLLYKRKLERVVLARFLVLAFVALAVIFFSVAHGGGGTEELVTSPMLVVWTAVILNLGYLVGIRLGWFDDRLAWMGMGQTIMDTLAAAVLVYLTGGVHSSFLFLLLLPVVSGGMLVSGLFSLAIVGMVGCCLAIIAMIYGVTIWHIDPSQYDPDHAREKIESLAPPGVAMSPWIDELYSELPVRIIAKEPAEADLLKWVFVHFQALLLVSFLVYFLNLRTREEILADTMDGIRDGVLVFDRGHRLLFCNLEARRVLGLGARANLGGIRLDRLRAGPGCEELLKQIRLSFAGRRAPHFLWSTAAGADDSAAPVIDVHIVQNEREQGVKATVIWFHDVTQRLRAEEAERRIDRLNATGTMAAGLAHEIRNPLAAIRSSAQQLDEDLRALGQEHELFDLLIRECDRLDGIVGSFLKFAKQSRPLFATVSLRALLEETAMLLPPSPEGVVTVRARCEIDGLSVRGDGDQLKQVLLNLGRNAVEAIGSRGGEVLLRAGLSPDRPGWARISVEDTGPGLTVADQQKLGTPFFTTKADGTGLGVAIATKIVAEHGSQLVFDRGPNGGTIAQFDLERTPLAADTTVILVGQEHHA